MMRHMKRSKFGARAQITPLGLALLAAIAIAPIARAQDSKDHANEVSPVLVAPVVKKEEPAVVGQDSDWTFRPNNQQILSIWPEGAYEKRLAGSAVLNCRVDIHGLAEECEIASEEPPGLGFGAAALLFRNTFKLKPAQGPNGPVESMMHVTVKFDAEHDDNIEQDVKSGMGTSMDATTTHQTGSRLEMREIMMLDHPVWSRAARFSEVEAAYPRRAQGGEGFAVAHCPVHGDGALGRCEVRKDAPHDQGFGEAAVALAARFHVDFAGVDIPRGRRIWVDIPFRFLPPGSKDARTLISPVWVSGFNANQAVKLYPPEAAAKGVTTGLGVAHCTVRADGGLDDCRPRAGEPDGLGFSEAAVKLAGLLRMNPWSGDGRPVDGDEINLPIQFNLKSR